MRSATETNPCRKAGAVPEGGLSCWKILGCARPHCPAFDQSDTPCWRMADTCCTEHNESLVVYKWELCAVCPVFKLNAEADSRGWNYFVSDQVKQFTRDVVRQAFRHEVGLIQVVNNLPYGLFTVDKEGVLNYINPAAEQIFGRSSTGLIGKHCRDVFEAELCESVCSVKNSGRSERTLDNRELTIKRSDGRAIPIICSTALLKGYDGNVIGGVVLFNDISALKRLEDDLVFSDRKYRRLFENSKDMVFITTRDGLFKDVNQAGVELLGYDSREELLALRSLKNLYANPVHKREFQKQIEADGFVKDLEVVLKRKDGTCLNGLVTGSAVRNPAGEIVGYEGIVKDITSRVSAVRNLQQRHQELSLLNWVALAMNMNQELDEMLMTVLNKVLDALKLSMGGIFLIDRSRSTFSLNAQHGLTRSGKGENCHVLLHDELLREALFQEDFTLTPRPIYPPFAATFTNSKEGNSVNLTCFLIAAKEKAYGFLALHAPASQTITEQGLNFLGSLGNFLGAAVEEARMLQTIENHREQLKLLTAKLFSSIELERKRIARELHDETGQALTAINFTLAAIEKSLSKGPPYENLAESIVLLKHQIDHTYCELHRTSQRLHPALLCDMGLEPALDSLLQRVSEGSELEIDFRMVGFHGRLDPETETVLYRLSQEALTNTLKHAKAKKFSLHIIKSYPHIILSSEDDGVGFNESELSTIRKGLGLVSMRERAAMMGGGFTLRSNPGEGTRIRIEIPIKDDV